MFRLQSAQILLGSNLRRLLRVAVLDAARSAAGLGARLDMMAVVRRRTEKDEGDATTVKVLRCRRWQPEGGMSVPWMSASWNLLPPCQC